MADLPRLLAWFTARRPAEAWKRFALALALVGFTFGTQVALWGRLPPSPDWLFHPAIFAIAWWLGLQPSFVAIGVSCVLIVVGFVEPIGALEIPYVRDAIDLAMFATVSTIGAVAINALHGALTAEATARGNAEAANRAKDEMLAIVSHDLRSPLTGILLSAQAICAEVPDGQVHDHAARIGRMTENATRLVADLLAFARVDAGELDLVLSPHPVRGIVERACEAAAPRAEALGVTLSMEIVDAVALCDDTRVQQVLSNLIANAVKFSPRDGIVVVKVERLGSHVGFEVKDNGPGIPPELRERIFERYFTQDRKQGAGLGLHIARMLVQAQGGEIGVDSTVGEGSAFWFTLRSGEGDPNRAAEHTTVGFTRASPT